MAEFTDAAWDKSVTNKLDAADYCKVCLIDYNPSGEDKIKAKCKLPIRATPGGPVNKAALRNAAARIFQMTGVPAEDKRKAAGALVRLMRQAKIEIGSAALLRLAGQKAE